MTDEELVELLYDCWHAGAYYGHPWMKDAPGFATWLRQKEIPTDGVSKHLTCEGPSCCRSMISGLCVDSHCRYCDRIGGSLMTGEHFDNCPGAQPV